MMNIRIITTSLGWQTWSRLLLWLPLCFLAVGCSSKFATVEGIVTLDGRSLDGGAVQFIPVAGGPLSYGTVADDGTFHLQTASTQGVLPGKYIATVSKRTGSAKPGMTNKQIEALEKIPLRYTKQNSSGLQFEVVPGSNSFELKMTSK